jgi:hypothetical protein
MAGVCGSVDGRGDLRDHTLERRDAVRICIDPNPCGNGLTNGGGELSRRLVVGDGSDEKAEKDNISDGRVPGIEAEPAMGLTQRLATDAS